MLGVYEAGPTGFGLAREAAERGIELRIAASGLIPRGPSDRVKTDRRDAERLIAAPDCGLGLLGRKRTLAKLRNLCDAAHSM